MTFVCACLQVVEGEPNVMWLSGLHIPESYLTALVQATCRKNGWPLDKSTNYTTVTEYVNADDVTERAHQGMMIWNATDSRGPILVQSHTPTASIDKQSRENLEIEAF